MLALREFDSIAPFAPKDDFEVFRERVTAFFQTYGDDDAMKAEFLSEKLETMPKLLVQKAVYAANKKKRELTLKQALKVVESLWKESGQGPVFVQTAIDGSSRGSMEKQRPSSSSTQNW